MAPCCLSSRELVLSQVKSSISKRKHKRKRSSDPRRKKKFNLKFLVFDAKRTVPKDCSKTNSISPKLCRIDAYEQDFSHRRRNKMNRFNPELLRNKPGDKTSQRNEFKK